MIEATQPFLHVEEILPSGMLAVAVITLVVIFIRAWFQATRP
jgi:Co/Zn/Cd efflux system component